MQKSCGLFVVSDEPAYGTQYRERASSTTSTTDIPISSSTALGNSDHAYAAADSPLAPLAGASSLAEMTRFRPVFFAR